MPEGARQLAVKKGLKEGTTYEMSVFAPSSRKAIQATVLVGRTEPVDLFGRVVTLTKMSTTMQSSMGRMTAVGYVDKDHDAQKLIMPMMGMNLEIISCSKEVALSPNEPVDFFNRFILKSPTPLGDLSKVKAVTYTLEPKGRKKLRIPVGDNQQVKTGADGRVTVTVRPIAAAAGQKLPYKGKNATALTALKPTRFVQSDDNVIKALAKKAVGDATDAAEAAVRIQKFVRKHIKTKDLSVGYASAVEVAASRQGDCTEHAVLVAALCRAAGIPAKVVNGVAYIERLGRRRHVFGPHAWNRVLIAGKWVGLDAALPGGYDAGHIEFGSGDGDDPSEFFGIVNTLGYFRITAAKIQR